MPTYRKIEKENKFPLKQSIAAILRNLRLHFHEYFVTRINLFRRNNKKSSQYTSKNGMLIKH